MDCVYMIKVFEIEMKNKDTKKSSKAKKTSKIKEPELVLKSDMSIEELDKALSEINLHDDLCELEKEITKEYHNKNNDKSLNDINYEYCVLDDSGKTIDCYGNLYDAIKFARLFNLQRIIRKDYESKDGELIEINSIGVWSKNTYKLISDRQVCICNTFDYADFILEANIGDLNETIYNYAAIIKYPLNTLYPDAHIHGDTDITTYEFNKENDEYTKIKNQDSVISEFIKSCN